jgi:hypothetical protein
MLENVLRKLLRHIGLLEVTDADLVRLLRVLHADRIPPYLVFGIASVYPIIEIALKKMRNSEIDFSELVQENDQPV